MRITLALVVALAGFVGEARADCLVPLQGVVEASFGVQSCRITQAPRPDKRRLVRIRVENLAVRIVAGPTDDPESLAGYEGFAANIRSARTVYVESDGEDACASFPAGRHVVASVEVMCCDTIPHRGLCALTGPIVRPSAPHSSSDGAPGGLAPTPCSSRGRDALRPGSSARNLQRVPVNLQA